MLSMRAFIAGLGVIGGMVGGSERTAERWRAAHRHCLLLVFYGPVATHPVPHKTRREQ